MYQQIYQAYQALGKGDKAALQRCNLKRIANAPAYFRALKVSGSKDTAQTQRILFLMVKTKISEATEAPTVAKALVSAGVKEAQIIQITRSGDNGIEYLKRQLIRCNSIQLSSLGELAQYWGDKARRDLLKDFILNSNDTIESNA